MLIFTHNAMLKLEKAVNVENMVICSVCDSTLANFENCSFDHSKID